MERIGKRFVLKYVRVFSQHTSKLIKRKVLSVLFGVTCKFILGLNELSTTPEGV
jgi:hypothetical protein